MEMPEHQLTWQGSNIAEENQPEGLEGETISGGGSGP